MSIYFHELIHIALSLLAGFFIGKIWKKYNTSVIAAFIGGVLIDIDHFIDYFLAFGFQFSIDAFQRGDQFSKLNKLYIVLHAWEWVILLLVFAFIIHKRKKIRYKHYIISFTVALALGMVYHLFFDSIANETTLVSYSIVYRIYHNFSLDKLIEY